MVRKLRFHEKKLLKKVDFIKWEVDKNNLHELKIMKRFHLRKREEYTVYNKMARSVRELARQIKELDDKDGDRVKFTNQLLEKLYDMGVIPQKRSLSLADNVTASSFCLRRLPVVMVKANMTQTIKDATKFVEQGHVRVGPNLVTDPGFLVTRNSADHLTWAQGSKIQKHLLEYNDMRDDFDLDD